MLEKLSPLAALLLAASCAGSGSPQADGGSSPTRAGGGQEAEVSPQSVESRAAAMAGEWVVIEFPGEELPAPAKAPKLAVSSNGSVAGFAGVNRFRGRLQAEGTLFGPLAITSMAGPPEAMALEAAFTRALGRASGYSVEEDRLTLDAGGEPLLVFRHR